MRACTTSMGGLQELFEVLRGAEDPIDRREVRHVPPQVQAGRGADRAQPHGIDSQELQVAQAR